jgi:HEAT repeat protein
MNRSNTDVPALDRTIDVLAKSHNEAAVPTLVRAVESADPTVFDGAIGALVARRSKAGHLVVLGRWRQLSASLKQLVLRRRGWMAAALRDALLSPDDQLFANARDVAEASGEFDLLPTLITVAEHSDANRSQAAIDLTLRLVEQLGQLIGVAKEKRDELALPELEAMRRSVLESLERSVERFRQHQRGELIEAFVVLAGPHSGLLKSIMDAPHHPCFQSVLQVLMESRSPAVLELLKTILEVKDAPPVVCNVVSKRTDAVFAEVLLAMPLDPKNAFLRKNLAKIKSLACLEDGQELCTQFDEQRQAAAIRLLTATGAHDDVKLDLAQTLLAGGAVAGRLAACTALAGIPGQRSSDLVLAALKDADAEVQAAAVRQLRQRRIPGALAMLMRLVSSPLEPVQRAAREALSEFSFDNYLTRFDSLDDEGRRTLGARVARIDERTLTRLREELVSPSRRQRLRGLDMAEAMGLVPQIADALVERLNDEDHLVRSAAADLLQYCRADDVRSALLTAVGDRSTAVQTAARNSLRALGFDIGPTPAGPQEAVR